MKYLPLLEPVCLVVLAAAAVGIWIYCRWFRQKTDTPPKITREQEIWYARKIAVAMAEKNYIGNEVPFQPYDDLYGLLMQIDNMAAGMERKQPEPPRL